MTDNKTVETFRVKLAEFVEAEKKSFALYDAIDWDAIDWDNMSNTEHTQTMTFHEAYQTVEKMGSLLRDMFIVITGRKIAARDFNLLLRNPAKILDIINAN